MARALQISTRGAQTQPSSRIRSCLLDAFYHPFAYALKDIYYRVDMAEALAA